LRGENGRRTSIQKTKMRKRRKGRKGRPGQPTAKSDEGVEGRRIEQITKKTTWSSKRTREF